MRALALDFGAVRTGVALSDPSGTIVRPLDAIQRAGSSAGIATIRTLVTEHDVEVVVIGLPIGLSGRDTKQTAQTRSFAARLRSELAVPVELYDERFTSRLADHTRSETGSTASRDSLAACHLLSSWMETRSA